MNNASSRALNSINPNLNHLNIRVVSKIIATKLIKQTELQFQFNPQFCEMLGVASHLNTHYALAYFIDDRFVKNFGVDLDHQLIPFSEIYQTLSRDFFDLVGDVFDLS